MDRGTTEGALLIELGGRLIEYRFARRRRRMLAITVDAAGLRVSAPLRAPWREIEAFLRDKERWILRKLDAWSRVPRAPVLHGVSGETLPLFGTPATLEVRPTAHYAAVLGVPAPRVTLSNARTQWGVCTEGGAIRLSWRLVHVEPRLADYVVAHEVAHLVEMNHSRRFWGLLAWLHPDWREARERLELAAATLPVLKGTR